MQSSLLDQVSAISFLKTAWHRLNKSNKESRGLSSETVEEFQAALEFNLIEVSRQLKQGKFKFSKVRGVVIPKKEKGKYRELRIAEVRDRLVLKAISIVLDQILTDKYDLDNECSYAYRKDRNVEGAIRRMVSLYKEGNKIILEADIKNFFGSVNRAKLLGEVFSNLPDTSLNDLIEQGMEQEVGNFNELGEHQSLFEESLSGIPQGNALSPLMANIYLSGFDKRMREEGFNMIRYADDFIVMCNSHKLADAAYKLSKHILEEGLGLTLHPLSDPFDTKGKSRIADVRYHKFSFLSIRFNGGQLWVNEKKVKQLKESIREVTDISKSPNLLVIFKRTKNLLEGWLSAYKFVDVDRDVSEIDSYINYQLYMAMLKLSFDIKHANTENVIINRERRRALTITQRGNTGVPLCKDFLSSIDRKLIII
ncbi:MAG TPA: reverse transcriptase domain-containing protein [Chitinophagales bacterium]|nr:reverse transcriptase domain-containing protein [Chitinophagales bacterium]